MLRTLLGMGASIFMLAAPAYAAGDADAGKTIFKKCAACHSLDAGKNGIGPSLHGLFGRKAGTAEGYRYSAAMTNSGIVWNEDALAKYLAAPQAVVKGTKMTFAGVKDPKETEDLTAYLKQASQ